MEVGRKTEFGVGLFQLADGFDIFAGGVAAVHCLQYFVGTRLQRQMQVRHQFFDFTMAGDEVIVDVGGVRGGVAQAFQAVDLGQPAQQIGQVALFAGRRLRRDRS